MDKLCPTCGGEGVLFEQLDVDYFKPTEVCPECNGKEFVEVLCCECEKPFTDEEWKEADHYNEYHTHKECCE